MDVGQQIRARIEVLEGLVLAFEQRHRVVDLLAEAGDRSEAERDLMAEFALTSDQVEAILAMRLEGLSSYVLTAWRDELYELRARLDDGETQP